MFTQIFNIALVASVTTVSALVIPRQTPPAGYATGYLEDYATYHTRYLALDCQSQHGTPFFDSCCHPMLATETLAGARAAECNPANRSASASATVPASTSVASASATVTEAPQATETALETCDEGSDDCECDDEGDDEGDECDDETSTVAASSTSVAASTSDVVTPSAVATSSSAVVNVAPTPILTTSSAAATSSEAPNSTTAKVTPSSTPKETSTQAEPSASPSSTPSSGAVQSGGVATFFFQNGVAGACGEVSPDDALIAAIDIERYGNTGVKSELCNKQVKITNTNNQKTVTVTIKDACPTCNNGNSIDLSVGAFTKIATEDEGEVPITWEFVN